jgi:hypothetical protein
VVGAAAQRGQNPAVQGILSHNIDNMDIVEELVFSAHTFVLRNNYIGKLLCMPPHAHAQVVQTICDKNRN